MPYNPGTNTGHGWVWVRPDHMQARCGGPALCAQCAADITAMLSGPAPAPLIAPTPQPLPDGDWSANLKDPSSGAAAPPAP